ncbi:MAG: hypothetical protein ACI35R_14305 [Bacillus sp. (in: firmicutes)]
MKIYKLAHICTLFIVLSGCSTVSSPTEEPSKEAKNEPVVLDITHKKEEEELIEASHARMIDEQITSSIGESKSYFTSAGDSPIKVYLLNTGTESFVYSIRNADDERMVANGVLKKNESYEQVFDDLPEGAYFISCAVQEDNGPINIALTVKTELVD